MSPRCPLGFRWVLSSAWVKSLEQGLCDSAPHAHVFPARDMALATPKAKLRQLHAGSELQPCSRLPPTTLIMGLKAQPLTPHRQMRRKGIPTDYVPGGSRVGVCLSPAPFSAALKKHICNLYEALEIGAFHVHVKPHWPSAVLSLCFTPDPSPVNPIPAAAIAVSVNIYRDGSANSEPGKFKVQSAVPKAIGKEVKRGRTVKGCLHWGAWGASAAKRMAGQTDKQGWHLDVSCLASICCHPNALYLQEML